LYILALMIDALTTYFQMALVHVWVPVIAKETNFDSGQQAQFVNLQILISLFGFSAGYVVMRVPCI
jgi:hypothetical protein